jgi:hypothetical protein
VMVLDGATTAAYTFSCFAAGVFSPVTRVLIVG